MISVVIPVGPEKHHKQYLKECIQSVFEQTHVPDEVLLISDMSDVSLDDFHFLTFQEFRKIRIWNSPWHLGVAHAFNFGIALAKNECVFTLGADDILFSDCLKECIFAFEREKKSDGWYYVSVQYSDGRPDQNLPCHAAMVTKSLWKKTGGLPVESASGAPDAAYISMALGSKMGAICKLYSVGSRPLYWYRVHELSDSASKGQWQGVIMETRNILTQTWKQPRWSRYE